VIAEKRCGFRLIHHLKARFFMKENFVRLVQLRHPEEGRRLAIVQEPSLLLIEQIRSAYELVLQCLDKGVDLSSMINSLKTDTSIDYDPVYNNESSWRLLPSFDHPFNAMECMISGTGLTHKNSALNRQVMHQVTEDKLTPSMQIYQWGLESGRAEDGKAGVQPEWFYKGTGNCLRAHGEVLELPSFGDDGGEEPEVAGVYVIDKSGQPWRVGFTTGNEFSDHIMERKNYLYLAHSKLRNCAIGPELVINADFTRLEGEVSITRNGSLVWSKRIISGESNMSHSLKNLEHHHFKYPAHRIPGHVHIHFFGADAFSFGENIGLETGDEMQVEWKDMGRALKNEFIQAPKAQELVTVKPLI
jgi:hypothetical protein